MRLWRCLRPGLSRSTGKGRRRGPAGGQRIRHLLQSTLPDQFVHHGHINLVTHRTRRDAHFCAWNVEFIPCHSLERTMCIACCHNKQGYPGSILCLHIPRCGDGPAKASLPAASLHPRHTPSSARIHLDRVQQQCKMAPCRIPCASLERRMAPFLSACAGVWHDGVSLCVLCRPLHPEASVLRQ